MQEIRLKRKRVYDPIEPDDGLRVLVDRLWPRGVRKEGASIDVWLKDIAPSADLRKWYCHQPDLFATFRELYVVQLQEDGVHRHAVEQVLDWLQSQPVTILFAAKDPVYNHAVVLHDFLAALMESEAGRVES